MKKSFISNTRIFLTISAVIVVVALIMQLCGFGLNLGIDFTGGSLLSYSVGESYDVNDVYKILDSAGYADRQVTKSAPIEKEDEPDAQVPEATVDAAADADADATVDPEATVAADEVDVPAEDIESDVAVDVPAAQTGMLLDMDKSSIEQDAATDLQIQLNLVDETKGLEDAIVAAVQGTLPQATLTSYRTLNATEIMQNDYDTSFTGGYVVEFEAGADFDAATVQTALEEALISSTVIEKLSCAKYNSADVADADAGTSLRVFVNVDDQTSKVRQLIEEQMSAKYENFKFTSIDHVSAVAGRDLVNNAVMSLLVAFGCMLVYIAIRFDLYSGLAALFGLVLNVLMMCAFMIFFRGFFKANSSFIAAVLTIIGYSINNTIVIFDRIRETSKAPGFTQKPRSEVVEHSVKATLSRTINTTVTTLILLVTLYAFGVDAIREFVFPLIVGIVSGVCISVLLCGQVWGMMVEKANARKAAAKKAGKTDGKA